MKFSQVRLLVDDFGAAYRFYSDVLGLGKGFGDEESGYASFDTGTGSLAIFERARCSLTVRRLHLVDRRLAAERDDEVGE